MKREKLSLSFIIVIILSRQCILRTQSIQYTLIGTNTQLICPYDGRNGNYISWWDAATKQLSFETDITANYSPDLKPRLNVTGDHAKGEYHLSISNVQKKDEGQYLCFGSKTAVNKTNIQLVVVIGPTNNVIESKDERNIIKGIEDEDIAIQCVSKGGSPQPNMTIQIGSNVFKVNSQQSIQHTLKGVNRSYDRLNVTCEANYEIVSFTPLMDTAVIKLALKPLQPTFDPPSVVTEDTKALAITCTSIGSRPAPTERQWFVGVVDITSSSTAVSSSLQDDDTFTAISILTFKFNRIYNNKTISCGFKNTASGNEFVQNLVKIEVRYAPHVTVQNKTFHLSQKSRYIECIIDSNPASSIPGWEHRSFYGELIRELGNSRTLVLPEQSEENRYQDTGEYICIAGNGIGDENGTLFQNGSGYIVSQAPPRFLMDQMQVIYGQHGKDIDIEVKVYSKPTYGITSWMKNGNSISQSSKYAMSDSNYVGTDTFYGTKVKLDAFKISLHIMNLEDQDFANYTLILSNGVGTSVSHASVLLPAFPPGVPINVTDTDTSESSITLQWHSDLNEEFEETFVIEYRVRDDYDWRALILPSSSNVPRDSLRMYKVVSLKAGTMYEFRIYAENKFGRSQKSTVRTVATACARELDNVSSSSFIGVAVGLSTVTMFSIIANVILLYRGAHGQKKYTKNRKSLEVYYNITGDKDDEDKEQTSEINVRQHYETLGAQEKPNEYEEISKKPKEKSTSTQVLTSNYETLGTKEKANVYDELKMAL